MRRTAIILGGALATLASATVSADNDKSKHGTMPAAAHAPMREGALMNHIAKWPEASRKAAKDMVAKYGPPAEQTATMLVWHKNGPWKRTVIYNHEVPHHFPMMHTDVMEQSIDYKAPVGMFDELATYDGSVVVDRTGGEISARCDAEPMNFLAINLAHEVTTEKKSVEEARRVYGMTAMAFKKGKSSDYTSKLVFNMAKTVTADPDKPLAAKMSQR